MITKGKMFWSLTKFSKLILEERYGDQCGEFECGSWGLKGIKAWLRWQVSQIHVRSLTGEKDTTLVRLTLSEIHCKTLFQKVWVNLQFQDVSERSIQKKEESKMPSNNYWMRLSMIWRIMHIEEYVICQGQIAPTYSPIHSKRLKLKHMLSIAL